MIISYNTHPNGLSLSTGYGRAGFEIVRSLQKLGHKVPFNDKDAPVQICFSHAQHFDFPPNQYKIGYMAWESTEFQPGWLEKLNNCDEVWATSDLTAKWFKSAGVNKPIYVYEHGISEQWFPTKRSPFSGKVKLLHHGAEANRKCGQQVFDAFLEVFGRNNDEVSITFKSNGPSGIKVNHSRTSSLPEDYTNNVHFITHELRESNLISLYNKHDALIGVSQGEGFGLTALQAMAIGMPVILNKSWAPYRRFALKDLVVEDKLIESPWPDEHPGNVFEPDFDSLCLAMEKLYYEYINKYSDEAYLNSFKIKEEYDWTKLTELAFEHIVKMF
jgi:glycosyltransferase involved in cell wall biosynthesis